MVSLRKTLKRVRNERDDKKKEMKVNEANHKTAVEVLEAEVARLESKEVSKAASKTSDHGDSDDEPKPTGKPNTISSSDTDDSDKSEVFSKSKKRKSQEELPNAEKKLKTPLSNILLSDGEGFEDDSFNNLLPVSDKVIGRNAVKNYEDKKNSIAVPTQAVKDANKDCVVTTLNNKISFLAIGEKARQKHDVATYGVKACGLHPVCSNILRGQEDIGYAYICSPTSNFHKYFEKNTWVCWYHCQASIDGHEVQSQQVHDESKAETPKNQKPKEPEQDAPTKDTKKSPKEPSKKSSKVNLENRLDATSSESEDEK